MESKKALVTDFTGNNVSHLNNFLLKKISELEKNG